MNEYWDNYNAGNQVTGSLVLGLKILNFGHLDVYCRILLS